MTTLPTFALAHDVTPGERRAIDALLDELEEAYASAEDLAFLADARRVAYARLPGPLVRFLTDFQSRETAPVVAVRGLPIDGERIGPTPTHWSKQPDARSTLREEFVMVLLASLLGDVFGWATLQDGHLLHNVLPIPNEEHEQSGHGSTVTLAWHTEDGFHPFRCDYLGLLGLRNVDRVPTTVAAVDAVDLDDALRQVLAQPRFILRPDDEHLYQRRRQRRGAAGPDGDLALPAEWTDPPPSAVLFGAASTPYLRIDPYYMSAQPGDDQAAAALAEISAQLDAAQEDLVIEPGTACFVDNYRAVHGRQSFTPRYDGTDRWLKKLLVTRDLRKSRAVRRSPDSRVLEPMEPVRMAAAAPGGAGGPA